MQISKVRGEGKFPKVPKENYGCIYISKLVCWRGFGDEATVGVLVVALKYITVLLGAVLLLVEPRLRPHTEHHHECRPRNGSARFPSSYS